MRTYAAVDLGASSGRVITGRVEGGRVVTEEVGRFPNGAVPVPTRGGTTLHWDVLALWSGILDGLRRAAAGGDLAAVGIDSWAVDHGLLDAGGALLGNPVHYRDARTDGVPEQVFAHLPAEELYATTGVQVQQFNTIFQLAAAAGTPALTAARRALLVPDLLGYWLTGAEVAEVTNASTTGLLDVRARDWSADVVGRLGAAYGTDVAGLLAPVVEPGTDLGPLRPEILDRIGLAPAGGSGSPGRYPHLVTVGSHDTASAVAAVPAEREDFAYISCGTWSLVGLELDAPVLTEASRAANLTNELGVDGTVRYLRNVMGLWVLQETLRTWRERGQDADLAGLLAAAADVPALRCVVDVDDPAFLPPGDMPARIAEAARRTGQRPPESPAETVRCILDSLALAYRRAVRTAAGLAGREVGVIHLVGGGARNALLCRLTAAATGLPVVAGPTEGAALGNLLVQAQSLGDVAPGLPALRRVVAASVPTTRYEPTHARTARDRPAGTEAAWDHAEDLLRP
ncbi:rhamnulokinase family protein [Georgenia sp. M64]|uniref:rhamnulokinase n=1 Tax=Georgenia sp. M64 TaxID=3120520 RepID=UPI0030E256E8